MRRIVSYGIDELVIRQEVTVTLPRSESHIRDLILEAAYSEGSRARVLRGQGGRPAPAVRAGFVDIRFCRLPGHRIQLDAFVHTVALYQHPQEAYEGAWRLLATAADNCARDGDGSLEGPATLVRLALCADVAGLDVSLALGRRLVVPAGVKAERFLPGSKPNQLSFAKFLKIYAKHLDAKRPKKAWIQQVWGTKVHAGEPVARVEFTWSRDRLHKAGHFDLDRLWREALDAFRLVRKPNGSPGRRRSVRPTDKLWRDLAKLAFPAPWTSPPALPIHRSLSLGAERAVQIGRLLGAAAVLIAAEGVSPTNLRAAIAEVCRIALEDSPGKVDEMRAKINEARARLGLRPFDLDEPPPPPPSGPTPFPGGPRNSRPFPTPPMPNASAGQPDDGK